MGKYKTEQEAFWAGAFGHEYVKRNCDKTIIASNLSLFSKILRSTDKIDSVLELGTNIGLNLIALKHLLPNAALSGVEINKEAAAQLRNLGYVNVHEQSILEFSPEQTYDLSFTKGVLIHIHPESLAKVYELLYKSSRKYILVAEYYNPAPVELSYRGHTGKLFKRDFAGEIMQQFPDVSLIDYGFAYRKDPCFPQDDITWFLLKKN